MVPKDFSLKKDFEKLILKYHSHEISLDDLERELLDLNPYHSGSMYHEFYNDFIEFNMESARNGSKHTLSLTSSGGILASFDE